MSDKSSRYPSKRDKYIVYTTTGPKINRDYGPKLSKYPEVNDTETKEAPKRNDILNDIENHETRLSILEEMLMERGVGDLKPPDFKPIPSAELALKITQLEGLKEQLSIAQAKEVVRILPLVFEAYTKIQILEFLKGGTDGKK